MKNTTQKSINLIACTIIIYVFMSFIDAKSNHLEDNNITKPISIVDSVTLVSRIRFIENSQCAIGDSSSEITLYTYNDGSVEYKFKKELASNNDYFRSYTPNISYTTIDDNNILIELDSAYSYYLILFSNPYLTEKVYGTVTLTCECCNGSGRCKVSGMCCPTTFGCETIGCQSECGLNVNFSNRDDIQEDFIIVKATSIKCIN